MTMNTRVRREMTVRTQREHGCAQARERGLGRSSPGREAPGGTHLGERPWEELALQTPGEPSDIASGWLSSGDGQPREDQSDHLWGSQATPPL